MTALTIFLIRHAEKPGRGFPGPGLTPKGKPNDESLVVRGWQRAGAWAALFGSTLGKDDYPRPSQVFAADPTASTESTSRRPFETAVPLAARLKLDLDTRFGVGQEKDLVAELLRATGVIAVFWEHKAIAEQIVPKLLAGQHVHGVPERWDGGRFDVALRFDRSAPGAPWSYRFMTPRLLDGDSPDLFTRTVA